MSKNTECHCQHTETVPAASPQPATVSANVDYDRTVEERIGVLMAWLKPRFTDDEMRLVQSAYDLARRMHAPQRRKSGEPYILHPIAVATIVGRDLQLGAHMVAAALLHDVVEDTPVTIDDVKDQFGNDVAFLVDVVTKRKESEYRQSKQIDNFRQLLDSIHHDIRGLLIKLADRLHNMRTLDSMKPAKQMKIAGETDYFYAPLANRLGLYHIKTELENLSFRYRCPSDYDVLMRQVENYREQTLEATTEFTDKLNQLIKEHGLKARTEVRYRMPYSIYRKMRTKGCDFDHVERKHYVRIVFPESDHATEKATALEIYSAITDYFKEKPGSTTNYIDSPKENGYESFHVKLLSDRGTWQEIHIASERMLRESRLGHSGEVKDQNIHAWLAKFRSTLEDVASDDRQDFLDSVATNFYNDDIKVFTPKGKEVMLPKGASALDFAFEIHSDIGRHAAYARVNGRLCSIKTVLKRGDCVEIGTSEDVHPSRDWMDAAHTYRAQRSLRNYFQQLPKLTCIRCRHCNPLPGDEVIGFDHGEGKLTVHKRNCPVAIRAASRHGDSIREVSFKEDPAFEYPVSLKVRGVDRYHLLGDIIECVTDRQGLAMQSVKSETVDNIATTSISFHVHSMDELRRTMKNISRIAGVDEVIPVEIG